MSMGTEGMKYSLVSREVIADCIETCVQGQWMDGVVVIGGCDKNMPGGMMGLARMNVPGIYVYGGTIRPGVQRRDIVSVFEAVGAHAAGTISDTQLLEVERTAIPGPGSCGGMYTANTMASAIEAMGMSLPYSSSTPAEDPKKLGVSTINAKAESLMEKRMWREPFTRRRCLVPADGLVLVARDFFVPDDIPPFPDSRS